MQSFQFADLWPLLRNQEGAYYEQVALLANCFSFFKRHSTFNHSKMKNYSSGRYPPKFIALYLVTRAADEFI